MAYNDYGAFVWLNGNRRKDKEDASAFLSDEDTFGEASENIPSGMKIFAALFNNKTINHGVLGDGDIRVICYKQGLPQIVEAADDTDTGYKPVEYYDTESIDYYEYDPINFEYRDYKFHFESGKPYYASMITPEGDTWECKYDYQYGAGF